MAGRDWQWGEDYIECRYPGSEEMARRQVPGILKLLGLERSSRILDCPCGWGRYSNPLAELGHKVTGIDFTQRFIDMAVARAPKKNRPRYEVMDMRDLDFAQEYDAVLNLLGSLGYYDRETDFSILANLARALEPGGRLMIDQYNREKMGKLPKRIRKRLPSGKLWITEQSMDYKKGLYRVVDTVVDGSERSEAELIMNWYSVDEYRALLARLSIEEVLVYGDFDGSPYSRASERQIIVARKPA